MNAVSSVNFLQYTPRGAWPRLVVRAFGVLLASVLAHALVLLWAQSELDDAWNTLPPAVPVVNVQLFVAPAPIALGARAKPAVRVPPRAITPPPANASPVQAAEPGVLHDASGELAPPTPTPPAPARTEPIDDAPPAPAPAPVDVAVVAFPKAGRMTYTTFGGAGILRMEGRTVNEWRVSNDRYEATLETRGPDGEVLTLLASTGQVRPASGVAPIRYTEKNRRRAEQAANFIWDRNEVTFSSTSVPALLVEGTQDRLSFQAQLALLAQAFPDRFQPGAVIAMNVVGARDVRLYDFRVSGWEAVRGDDGTMFSALKLDRPMNAERPDVRIEIWLAPSLKWLPVRVRLTFANGSFGDNVLLEAKFDD